VFDGIPQRIPSAVHIAPRDEPGEPLRIDGVVRDATGRPVPGVIVYAYHTDAKGIYPRGPESWPPRARRHGLLRGWARTDSLGRYRFETIRPASYPNTAIPQHVHMHVIEPECCTYWIDDIHFEDDPLLTARERHAMSHGRGGEGIATPRREDGVWIVTRDIVLGVNVPGYAEARGAVR
jgi:protocatechuate 3,4-dioxygenase beta subunit